MNLCSAGQTGSGSAKLSPDHKIREYRARRNLKSSASRSSPCPTAQSATRSSTLKRSRNSSRFNHPNAILASKVLPPPSSVCHWLQEKAQHSGSYCSRDSLLTHSNSSCCCYRAVWDLITKHLVTFHLQSTSQPLTN